MRGKIVNLCIGFTNILFGAMILIFTRFVPQDKTLLTVQESTVVNNVLLGIYVIMAVVIILDIIQYYNLRRDTVFNTAYMIGVFAISFVFIKIPLISIFNILAGLIIVIKSLKENLVEIDSMTAIYITVVVMIACVIFSALSLSYKNLGEKIKNKENKDELSYVTDYFKYVTELEGEYKEAYINIKKDGKYGYITESGNLAIDFLYDYASPFVKINMYNKQFEIALVCQNGSSYIILKNGRKVLSYRSESEDDNYGAKLKELQKIYTETLSQPGTMEFEIPEITENIEKRPVYKETPSENYTFRYDYNDEYDLIVTQSNLGLGDKFELAKKDDLNIRLTLNTSDLDYDSEYLYIYSNGNIPYYEISKYYQGWFTSYGKKIEMRGRAQILEFYDDKILIRNYNNKTIYFIDSGGNPLSELYKDIYVVNKDRYIVRTSEDKEKVINGDFSKSFEAEYDIINSRLIGKNLYLCMNLDNEVTFNDYGYAKLNFSLLDQDGNVILDNIEQVYDLCYDIEGGKRKNDDQYSKFIEKLKDLKYDFVGDKFYSSYKE